MSVFMIILVVFVQLLNRYVVDCHIAPGYCYSLDKDKNYTSHFASKTIYPLPSDENGQQFYNITGCTPKKIWILQRHGTRNPKSTNMKDYAYLYFLKQLVNKTGDLCPEDYELLKNWSYDKRRSPMTLSDRGRIELQYIAWNFRRMFPNLFNTTYTRANYYFLHTSTNRTRESYQVFVDQLFGQLAHQFLPKPKAGEIMLRPFVKCPTFTNNSKFVAHNEHSEVTKFQNSNEFKEMLKDISLRLGINDTLTAESALVIWTVCIFDHVLNNTSPWCTAFTKKHQEMYEYLSDLKDYYLNSYGNKKINEKLPCRLFQDIIKKLYNIDAAPIVTTYFAHSTTLMLLLTTFGVFEDEQPLRADNFAQQLNRKFRGSTLSPFAANIAAVRYQCVDVDKFNSEKILFLLNQKPLPMKWCKNQAICTLKEVKVMFESTMPKKCSHAICDNINATKEANDINAEKTCTITKSGSKQISFSILTLIFCFCIALKIFI